MILFENEPIKVTLELFAFRDFLSSSDISAGDKICETTLTIDNSARLDEVFDNYIRIPFADFDVDPDLYPLWGGADDGRCTERYF